MNKQDNENSVVVKSGFTGLITGFLRNRKKKLSDIWKDNCPELSVKEVLDKKRFYFIARNKIVFKVSAAFSLIELIIVLSIISILAGLSTPQILHVIKSRQSVQCAVNRIDIQNAERRFVVDYGRPTANLDELLQVKYIDAIPQCPANGIYMWIKEATADNPFRNLGCSIHYFPTQIPVSLLTPIGSTFQEISSNFIQLLEDYYDKNDKYARSWGDYAFTDIGLNPSDWENGVSGIIYTPVGDRLNISPANGYVFYFTDNKGEQKMINPERNWDIVYSLKNDSWYYRKVDGSNKIDIATLRVEKK